MQTTTKQKMSPQTPANTARPRRKILLADTIAQYLCQNQSSAIPHENALNSHLSVPTAGPLSRLSPISSHVYYPPRRIPSSNRTSSDTLATNSDQTTLNYTSDVSVGSKWSNSSSSSHNPSSCSRIVSLSGTVAEQDVEGLAIKYGLASQMGLLDPSYRVFINDQGTAALSFKVLSKVAVIMGDPMCEPVQIPSLLQDFKHYRRRKRWGMSILGATGELVQYASINQKWTMMQFGNNRVFNPLTNEIIHETGGKRILTQNRQLLNPAKGGITLDIYSPTLHGTDFKLEAQLVAIYDAWRLARNSSGRPQAFVTEYDPFLMPSLMTYIYTRDPTGAVNGFTALRWLGAKGGYHVDPCIAAPGARKGISDLLLFASMAYARQLGISYLSVGYEPSESLGEVSGMPAPIARLTDRIYQYTYHHLTFGGKKAYFDKFKPDSKQDSPVYVIFPSRIPEPRPVVAVAHVANISIRRLLFDKTS